MLSVLIADDEKAICFLLHKLIHWDELGLSPLGIASNGAEAYRIVEEQKPDIVITDIQMPVMNGLDLIEKVREVVPDTSFVIVSGYQEFEYAKQAIRFGVEDYLLKPIKEVELNSILQRICKKKMESSEIAVLREEREKMRKIWLTKILDGEEDQAEAGRQYFHLDAGSFYFVQIFVGSENDVLFDRENELVAKQLAKSYLDEFGENLSDLEAVLDSEGSLSLLTCMKRTEKEEERQIWKLYHDFLNRAKVKYANRKITMAISQEMHSFQELPAAARKMRRLMRGRAFVDQGEPLLLERFAIPDEKEKIALSPQKKIELMRVIDSKEETEAWGFLQDLLKAEKKETEAYPWAMFELLEVLGNELAACLQELGLWDEQTEQVFLRWKRQIAFYHSYGKMTCEVRKLLQEIFDIREKKRKEMENRPVKLAKAYVNEHYHEAVTMEDVAAWTGLNSAYFSSLFKKSEGVNFTEYLTQVRLAKAKAYLVETSLNLAEIAAKVGYTDAKYFSKVFIKNVGIRPAEYRKIHL
ncbi:response regulator transcription factor [Hominifimenecus sp. rT4P-3]|uniref:response regulator transcription factor n=1 Tax=Hominifimenecus sp. rT4P-3 TaxID=3242979 RepID=UPI003DA3BCD6